MFPLSFSFHTFNSRCNIKYDLFEGKVLSGFTENGSLRAQISTVFNHKDFSLFLYHIVFCLFLCWLSCAGNPELSDEFAYLTSARATIYKLM